MALTLILIAGIVAAAIFLGIMLGRLSARAEIKARVEEAYKKAKDEAEVEKAAIALSLGEQLSKVGEGIFGLAQAYEGTVRLVQERLSSSVEFAHSKTSLSLEPRTILNLEALKSNPQLGNRAPENSKADDLTEEDLYEASAIDLNSYADKEVAEARSELPTDPIERLEELDGRHAFENTKLDPDAIRARNDETAEEKFDERKLDEFGEAVAAGASSEAGKVLPFQPRKAS